MKAKRYPCPRDGCDGVIREKASIGPRDRLGVLGVWGGVGELMHCYRCRWEGGITETITNPAHERLCPDCDGTLILGI